MGLKIDSIMFSSEAKNFSHIDWIVASSQLINSVCMVDYVGIVLTHLHEIAPSQFKTYMEVDFMSLGLLAKSNFA